MGAGSLLSQQQSTPLVPAERRVGTYERDDDVTSLLCYGTHTIFDLPRDRVVSTMGKSADRDLVVEGDDVSARHCVLTRRSSGVFVSDDASTNGLAYEVSRNVGLALKPTFEDKRETGEGFQFVAGMTFVVGTKSCRFIALDEVMRRHHPMLVQILGREDDMRALTDGNETPTPSDLVLTASGPSHLLITGKPGCEQEELARIIHRISRRRRRDIVEIDHVPDDRQQQNEIIKEKSANSTLVLNLGEERSPLDPTFVSSAFSLSYQVRVIVIARTARQARRALGHHYWRLLLHIALAPLSQRRTAIHRLLDEQLAAAGSVLRVADLTPENQRVLLKAPWRENLQALREAAVRLDAIVNARFSRRQAAASLGVVRQTLDHWFANTMKLTKPLVPDVRKRALLAALADHRHPR